MKPISVPCPRQPPRHAAPSPSLICPAYFLLTCPTTDRRRAPIRAGTTIPSIAAPSHPSGFSNLPPAPASDGWGVNPSQADGYEHMVVFRMEGFHPSERWRRRENPEFRIQNPGEEAGSLTPEFRIRNSRLFVLTKSSPRRSRGCAGSGSPSGSRPGRRASRGSSPPAAGKGGARWRASSRTLRRRT
jgi:hypothetical protein